MKHSSREISALYYLVFCEGMSIDDGLELIAESHHMRVRFWAQAGRRHFRNFESYLHGVIDGKRQFDGIPVIPMSQFK